VIIVIVDVIKDDDDLADLLCSSKDDNDFQGGNGALAER